MLTVEHLRKLTMGKHTTEAKKMMKKVLQFCPWPAANSLCAFPCCGTAASSLRTSYGQIAPLRLCLPSPNQAGRISY